MTWPPTRPVRRRLFGVMFLAVWVVGMYVLWGWASIGPWASAEDVERPASASDAAPSTIQLGDPLPRRGQAIYTPIFDLISVQRIEIYGAAGWLVCKRVSGPAFYPRPDMSIKTAEVVPRGLAAALIMTAVSSLILYVAWRAAVHAFTCAAGTCDTCGYDLTGLVQPRCPECGMEVAD